MFSRTRQQTALRSTPSLYSQIGPPTYLTMTVFKKGLVVDHLSRSASTDTSYCSDDEDCDDLRGEFIADLYLSPKLTVRKEFIIPEPTVRSRNGSFDLMISRKSSSARLPPIVRSVPSSPIKTGMSNYDADIFDSTLQSPRCGDGAEPRRTKSLTTLTNK